MAPGEPGDLLFILYINQERSSSLTYKTLERGFLRGTRELRSTAKAVSGLFVLVLVMVIFDWKCRWK
jgi:hypothetical protein